MSKAIKWHGSSLRDVRRFDKTVRINIGHQLDRLQNGLEPVDWKPMPSVGKGVKELRVRGDSGAYRVIYVVQRPEAVHVVHAFQKKTKRTSKLDLDIARKRFKGI